MGQLWAAVTYVALGTLLPVQRGCLRCGEVARWPLPRFLLDQVARAVPGRDTDEGESGE